MTGFDAHPEKELHIAPMLDVSYREFRYFMRLLTKRAILWTEMIVDETLVYSQDPQQHVFFEPSIEPPVICQLGGCQPQHALVAVQVMKGYDEINLNMECPSNRVAGKRGFGAALMKDLDLAVQMLHSMKEGAPEKIISVKTRIGVDHKEGWEFLESMILRLREVCSRFYIHARKVYPKGLKSARQNRRIPPLNYIHVYRLCERFPDCDFYVNGGIDSLVKAKQICYGAQELKEESDRWWCMDGKHHQSIPCDVCQAPFGSCIAAPLRTPPNLRGCMMGRAAMDEPALFGNADVSFFNESQNPSKSRREVIEKYSSYLEKRFPRRCCDSDDRVTNYGQPIPEVVFESAICDICSLSDDDFWRYVANSHCGDLKITSRLIDRCLKPTLGLFSGLPGARQWRRDLTVLSRHAGVRNCGPSHMLKRCMARADPLHLDLEFGSEIDC
jgi:tRNA-dihydrouridine synthase A